VPIAQTAFSLPLVLELVGFAVVVILGVVWLRSALSRQRTDELSKLAETRGHRIEDLETEVGELRREIAELRGRMQAIQELKVQDIAEAVAVRILSESHSD